MADIGSSGQLVLEYAQRDAAELFREEVGTEHLFLGQAELEDLQVRRLFQRCGMDLDEVRLRIRKESGAGTGHPKGQLTLTGAAQQALDVAKEEATRLGQELVEAPHILLGVLRDRDGLAAKVLTDMGADLDALERETADLLPVWVAGPVPLRAPPQESEGATAQAAASPSGTPVLDGFGRDLTQAAADGELRTVIGRDEEVAELRDILLSMRKNCAVIVGDAGVGKTAIVNGLAQRIVNGDEPLLKDMRIHTLDVGSIVAGTVLRGMFEQRIKDVLEEVKKRSDLILFIDEMHMLVGAGSGGMGDTMDAANMLKPALSDYKLKVIGATTIDEYRKHLEPQSALMRRFQKVIVDEPKREDAIVMLQGLRPKYQEFHGVTITDGALETSVDLTMRYVHDRFLPDKAFDVLDRTCTEKRQEAAAGDDTAAAQPAVVDADDVAEMVSVMLEIPVGTITEGAKKRLAVLDETLKRHVIGQDHVIDVVTNWITGARMAIERERQKPLGVFFFSGPTGTGKTMLAGELAVALFGDKRDLVVLNMSQYAEPHSVSELIGSKPGYVGWDEGGRLTNAVRSRPYSVVVLDEIEKAHPQVWNLLLPVIGEPGQMTDALGRVVDFRNTVIVATSNVGARRFGARPIIGFRIPKAKESEEPELADVAKEVRADLTEVFAPEFLNRFDEIVVFNTLPMEAIRKIVRAQIDERLALQLKLSTEALEFLAQNSYDPAMGARPVGRAIQRLVVNPLSRMMVRDEIAEGDTVHVGLSNGELTFEKERQGAAT